MHDFKNQRTKVLAQTQDGSEICQSSGFELSTRILQKPLPTGLQGMDHLGKRKKAHAWHVLK